MEHTFRRLCEVFKKIEETTSRLEIQQTLYEYLKTLDRENMIVASYLCVGTIYPTHVKKELNIGEAMLNKVTSELTGQSVKNVKKHYNEVGDFGEIICKYKINALIRAKKEHMLLEVFNTLKKICDIEGKEANMTKKKTILKILVGMSNIEIKYFVRILQKKLKIGLALQTVLTCLGMIYSNHNTTCDIVKNAYNRCASVEILINKIHESGIESLNDLEIVAQVPFRPMLCNPLDTYSVCFTSFVCEAKYDGERVQIHRKNSDIRLYSRNGENMTEKYPDLVDVVRTTKHDFVLDGEIVAFDTKTNKILPFQILSTRKRKEVHKNRITVCVFVFDILYFDGKCLLNATLKERKNILEDAFEDQDGLKHALLLGKSEHNLHGIEHMNNIVDSHTKTGDSGNASETVILNDNASIKRTKHTLNEFDDALDDLQTNKPNSCQIKEQHIDDKTASEANNELSSTTVSVESIIEDAFSTSIKDGYEGLIIKNLDSVYIPDKRSNDWLKLKKDYLNMVDTLDLVVMGAYYGRGKRIGTYGGFLMGCCNNSQIEAVCKLGTGFDEKTLSLLKTKLKTNSKASKLYKYSRLSVPDVWIEPEYVFEVNAASVSKSTLYTTKLSLRFPRFVRIRNDKKIEDATSLSYIKLLIKKQK